MRGLAQLLDLFDLVGAEPQAFLEALHIAPHELAHALAALATSTEPLAPPPPGGSGRGHDHQDSGSEGQGHGHPKSKSTLT